METKIIDNLDEVIRRYRPFESQKLNDKEMELAKRSAIIAIFEAAKWLEQNRKDQCFCPDCDPNTHDQDSYPCKNQHIKDLFDICSYWDGRLTEDEFKKRMTIGYDFINDEWKNEKENWD